MPQRRVDIKVDALVAPLYTSCDRGRLVDDIYLCSERFPSNYSACFYQQSEQLKNVLKISVLLMFKYLSETKKIMVNQSLADSPIEINTRVSG